MVQQKVNTDSDVHCFTQCLMFVVVYSLQTQHTVHDMAYKDIVHWILVDQLFIADSCPKIIRLFGVVECHKVLLLLTHRWCHVNSLFPSLTIDCELLTELEVECINCTKVVISMQFITVDSLPIVYPIL